MMLQGMGFNNSTSIYLAAGEIYQSKRNLAPLLRMFPLLQTKETLAMPKELAPFNVYSYFQKKLFLLLFMLCLILSFCHQSLGLIMCNTGLFFKIGSFGLLRLLV